MNIRDLKREEWDKEESEREIIIQYVKFTFFMTPRKIKYINQRNNFKKLLTQTRAGKEKRYKGNSYEDGWDGWEIWTEWVKSIER